MTFVADGVLSVGQGRYLLGTELGRGGMAVVLRGWDTVLHRQVAVKLLRDVVMDPSAGPRFEGEGKLLAALDHPGLITIFDAGIEDDRPYLVMEVVDGQTLAMRLGSGPVPPADVASMGAALAAVLGHIHAHGVTHRDVKPSNVLIDSDGRVRLADFGIARHGDDTARHTATGVTIGTAAYLSPEQARGETGAPPSDIYALGLVLLEALTGKPAYSGTPPAAALARLLSPPHIPGELPSALRSLLSAMTASAPADRPSAAEVKTWLESFLASGGQEARQDANLPQATIPATRGARTADPQAAAAALPVSSPPRRRDRRPTEHTGSRRDLPVGVLATAGGSVLLLVILFVAALTAGNGSGQDAGPGASPPAVTSPSTGPAAVPAANPSPSQQPSQGISQAAGSPLEQEAAAGTDTKRKSSDSGKNKGHGESEK